MFEECIWQFIILCLLFRDSSIIGLWSAKESGRISDSSVSKASCAEIHIISIRDQDLCLAEKKVKFLELSFLVLQMSIKTYCSAISQNDPGRQLVLTSSLS